MQPNQEARGERMIRALYYSKDNKLRMDLKPMDVAFVLREPGGVLWVDFEGATPEESAPILLETFGFHPLAVDDALQESHLPKIDDWGSYLYIVLHTVLLDQRSGPNIHTQELDIFLGDNYIVTHHDEPIEVLNRTWDVLQRDRRHLQEGVDHLLYRLADEVATHYLTIMEQLDEGIDRLETEIFRSPRPPTLERIFAIKRSVLHLRRIVAPQREVLSKLARDDFAMIDQKDRVYFRDIYDHMVRLYDIIEGVRDLVSGSIDTYLSMTNNRMNEIMKTLTIITTVFMPLTFITGFFGMNFFGPVVQLPAWTGMPAFWITLFILFLTPLLMYLWMRGRGWMKI
jgi:magnesium transporter